MQYRKSVSLFLLIGLTSFASFGANRFLNLPVIRCVPNDKPALAQTLCEGERSGRLSRQHINKEEFDFLNGKNAIPSFTIDNQPYGYCYCGCFAPWTRLSVLSNGIDSLIPIGEIIPPLERFEVMALDKSSTLDKLVTRVTKVNVTISGPESDPLVVATTRAGVELAVTTLHPVLLSNGQLIPAKDLQVGQSLVDISGPFDEIIDVSRKTIAEEVINVMVVGEPDIVSHLLPAENRIVGDIYVQNAAQSEIDAVNLRE